MTTKYNFRASKSLLQKTDFWLVLSRQEFLFVIKTVRKSATEIFERYEIDYERYEKPYAEKHEKPINFSNYNFFEI